MLLPEVESVLGDVVPCLLFRPSSIELALKTKVEALKAFNVKFASSHKATKHHSDGGSVNSKQSVVSLEKRCAELQRHFNHTSSAPLAQQGCDKGGETTNISTSQRDRQETSSDSVRSAPGTQRMLRRLSSADTSSSASYRH